MDLKYANYFKFKEYKKQGEMPEWAIVKFAGDKWICKSCGSRKRGRRWQIRWMSLMWKWQDLDTELIWSEKAMSESVKDETKIASRWLGWYHCWDKFVRSENLRRCCFVPLRRNSVFDGLRSSLFKLIQDRMSLKVVVSVSRNRAKFVGVKQNVQLGVISEQMILEGIVWDHQAKRSCIASEKEWAKYGTLGYTTGKSRECRDGIIDWDCLRAKWEIRWEPIKRQTIKTEPILKTSKKDGMIDSIEGNR